MNRSFSVFCDINQTHDITCNPRNKRRRRKRKHVPHAKRSVEFVENRNRRERERVRELKAAFENLRKHVPYCDQDDRVSKVDILLAATDYIHGMMDMIHKYDHNAPSTLRNTYNLTSRGQMQGDLQWTNQKLDNGELFPTTRTTYDKTHLKTFITPGFQTHDLFASESELYDGGVSHDSTLRQYRNQYSLIDENNYQTTNHIDFLYSNHKISETKRFVSQNETQQKFPAIPSDNCCFYNQSYPSLTKSEYCQQIEYSIL